MSFFRNLFNRFNRQTPDPVADPISASLPTRIHVPVPRPSTAFPLPGAPLTTANAFNAADCVTFPLKAVTDLLSPELKAVLRKQPSEHVQIQIPRALLKPQLAMGAVRITYAQLCAATPEVFLHPDAAPADSTVALPLDIIVRQMSPSRRDDQRPPAIPTNIPSIFGKAGGAAPEAPSPRSGAEAWYTPRRPTLEIPAEPQPAAPPAVIANGRNPSPTPPASPLRIVPAHSTAPISAPISLPTPPPVVTPEPVPFPPITPAVPPVPAAVPNMPAAPTDSLAIPLASIASALPPSVAESLNPSASFQIPLADLDSRMRAGKLVFKLAQLREFSTIPLAHSLPADTEIELPLPAVVPLYLAARKAPAPRKQLEIDSRIPDVFSKSPTPPSQPPSAEPEPIPTQAVTEPEPAAPLPTTPAQIIQRIRGLDGISGAFIATADGFLVAGDAPDAVDSVLAAFAPALFSQLLKLSVSAHLGAPESIDIRLASSQLHLRKASTLYLGVLTPPGHQLPVDQITEITLALQTQAP